MTHNNQPASPRLVLASRNPGKIRELQHILSGLAGRLCGLDEFPGVGESPETGGTFAGNACEKAMYYAAATGLTCLADDSGLEVDALDGRPGVNSARYAADQCPAGADRSIVDRANNARLLSELAGVPPARRMARFVCHVALARPSGVIAQAFDTLEGRIGFKERGKGGFGYDPLFILDEYGLATAELPARQKNAISHRGKAVREFGRLLDSLLR